MLVRPDGTVVGSATETITGLFAGLGAGSITLREEFRASDTSFDESSSRQRDGRHGDDAQPLQDLVALCAEIVGRRIVGRRHRAEAQCDLVIRVEVARDAEALREVRLRLVRPGPEPRARYAARSKPK